MGEPLNHHLVVDLVHLVGRCANRQCKRHWRLERCSLHDTIIAYDALHPVCRLFYRDEYVVVLDALALEPLRVSWHRPAACGDASSSPPAPRHRPLLVRVWLLQDDGLHDRFGLHERQVRKILQDLERESLVWREKVSERCVPVPFPRWCWRTLRMRGACVK